MTGGLYRLVYCSRSMLTGPPAVVDAGIGRILDVARRNNEQLDITGALLFNSDCFAQALEGSYDAVERTFEAIACDGRHTDVTVLEFVSINERDFSAWSMAYAGRIEDERAHFDALTGTPCDGAGAVLELLKNVVLRADGLPRAVA